jgi:hypothetical protein
MSTPPPRGNPDDKYRQPDAPLGGADAVEKTTYVTGSGTDPERTRGETVPPAKGSSGAGPNTTWAIIVFLAVGAVLVYVLGFGT